MQARSLRGEVHLEVIGVERGHSSGASTVRTDRVEETPSDQEGGQRSVLTGLLSGGVAQGEGRAVVQGTLERVTAAGTQIVLVRRAAHGTFDSGRQAAEGR